MPYVCDHKKNKDCKKNKCFYLKKGNCRHTLDQAYELKEVSVKEEDHNALVDKNTARMDDAVLK